MRRKVVLCPNPFKDKNLEVTLEARELLIKAGMEVVISPEFLGDEGIVLPDGLDYFDLEEALEGAVLVVSLGGDGTIMHTARRMVGFRVPLIGVNLGSVGFLSELDRTDLGRLVVAAQGNFVPSPRMMLRVELVRKGEVIFSSYALNDATVHGVMQIIHIVACGDGRRILEFNGDGIVVSSPTGSSAYSMSAGGPLVEPTVENLILTPICPHALLARSCVLAPDRVVTVELSRLRGKAMLSVDGVDVDIQEGDTVRVRKSGHQTMLAHVGSKSFYDIVFEKLGDTK
ncbi:MAG: NAD(+)/NADH kinase [Oscillospiraceae bacterium]|nr:NAD(+)/NADH kinase [Oscillospiraceae bacterium]